MALGKDGGGVINIHPGTTQRYNTKTAMLRRTRQMLSRSVWTTKYQFSNSRERDTFDFNNNKKRWSLHIIYQNISWPDRHMYIFTILFVYKIVASWF